MASRKAAAVGGASGGAGGVARRTDDKGVVIEDFDAEAHKLWESIGLRVGGEGGDARGAGRMYNDLDPVYRRAGGGTVFIGNHNAASNLATLDRHKIRHIVNCQEVTAPNFHESKPDFHYLRFPVAVRAARLVRCAAAAHTRTLAAVLVERRGQAHARQRGALLQDQVLRLDRRQGGRGAQRAGALPGGRAPRGHHRHCLRHGAFAAAPPPQRLPG